MAQKKESTNGGSSVRKGVLTALAALVLFLLYAYATDVTQINLEEPQKPQRQEVTTRVLRALARPDFLEYEEETWSMNVSLLQPCPEEIKGTQASLEGRVVTLAPNCTDTTQDVLTMTGTGFRPRTSGIIRWYPPGAVSTTRALSSFRTDVDGNFEETFSLPDIRATDEPQRIEVEEKWRTGIAGLSSTSIITIEKIIETVFMALMATTVGTLLAVPISFLAARNLMVNVGSPLAAIMSGIIALPIGAWAGLKMMGLLLGIAAQASGQLFVAVIAAAVAFGASWAVVTLGPPLFSDKEQSGVETAVSTLRMILFAIFALLGIGILSNLGITFGDWLEDILGSFGFVGRFVALAFEAFLVLSPGIVGLLVGLVAMSMGSKYGQEAVLRVSGVPARILTAVTSAIGMAIFIYGVGNALNWLYQYDEPELWTTYPAIVGGVIMLAIGYLIAPKRPFPIGSIIYTVTRGILNIIRSIEPLIYVIVFAVWVGIGPFAGVLALTGHTIAALGKLFSEQVENIAEGPLEAITATGANRLQTIVFGVVPQVVPPYIAFTLYRWDINVRFSTVIGFGGGGGIGFILVQNINLLKYRQASVMMIAIAIVVISLDFISSRIRTRII